MRQFKKFVIAHFIYCFLNKSILPICLSSLLLFTSCNHFIALILFGINDNYTGATPGQIIKYATRYKLQNEPVYILTRKGLDSLKSSSYKPKWGKGFRPISFKVFNKAGNMITLYASCEDAYPPKYRHNILDSFPTKHFNYTDSTWTIDKELKSFRSFSKDSFYYKIDNNSDLYIVVYWATYTGKIGRGLVNDLKSYASKHSDHKITLIEVNSDLVKGVNCDK